MFIRLCSLAGLLFVVACGDEPHNDPPPGDVDFDDTTDTEIPGDDDPPPVDDLVATLAVVGGAGQSASAGAELPSPVVVVARAAGGTPIAGAIINWRMQGAEGDVLDSATLTDADGRAETGVRAPNRVGTYTVEASHAYRVRAETQLTVTAAAPVRLRLIAHGEATVGVGDELGVEVEGEDAFGNVTSTPTVTWATTGGAIVTADAVAAATVRFGALGDATVSATSSTGASGALAFVIAEPEHRYVELVGGPGFACGRTGSGVVYCWGSEEVQPGSLGGGDGSVPATLSPRPVALPAGSVATAISAGVYNACAALASGEVYCWGLNEHGALGRGPAFTEPFSGTPAPVVGIDEPTVALSVGSGHNCAVGADGAVRCWGSNAGGQLGGGATIERGAISDIWVAGAGVARVAVDGLGMLTTSDDGATWDVRASGLPSRSIQAFAVDPADGDIIFVGMFGAGVAYSSDGGATFATRNLGLGSLDVRDIVVLPSGRVIAGTVFGAFISDDAGATWSEANEGMGEATFITALAVDPAHPLRVIAGAAYSGQAHVSVDGGSTWTPSVSGFDTLPLPRAFAFADDAIYAVLSDGGTNGELVRSDDDGATWSSVAEAGSDLRDVAIDGTTVIVLATHEIRASLDGGDSFELWSDENAGPALARMSTQDGRVLAAGPGRAVFRAPDGTVTRRDLPNVEVVVTVTPPPGVQFIDVATNYGATCALTADGRVFCWGTAQDAIPTLGDLSPGEDEPPVTLATPTAMAFFGDDVRATSIVSSDYTSCVTTQGGAGYCWGTNNDGALANGETQRPTRVPARVVVESGRSVMSFGAVINATCAVLDDGHVHCAGYTGSNMLGSAAYDDVEMNVPRFVPVAVPDDVAFANTVLSAGGFGCALALDGRAFCWGVNYFGELGGGAASEESSLPVEVVAP